MCAKYITGIGIAVTILGTVCFAYEAIKTFSAASFEIKSMGYRGQGAATKTPELVRYDERRIRAMWVGLILTVFGNLIQLAALFFD